MVKHEDISYESVWGLYNDWDNGYEVGENEETRYQELHEEMQVVRETNGGYKDVFKIDK